MRAQRRAPRRHGSPPASDRDDRPFFRKEGSPSLFHGKSFFPHAPLAAAQHTARQGGGSHRTPRRDGAGTADSMLVQRNPAVGFNVKALNRTRGMLDDPSFSGNQVGFPLSFAVHSPLEASALVEVTGARGDPCSSYHVGFIQTAHIHWLHVYYWGRHRGDGSVILKANVALPIRDGEPGTFWYASTAHESPTGCNVDVEPGMDDYPTIWDVDKVRPNGQTGQPNYLTGITRGLHLVTTLIATNGSAVIPLRHFYWNYLMDIRFTPNYASPQSAWPFAWEKNQANLGGVGRGRSGSVPMFTTATTPYNQSLTWTANERR